MLTKTTARTLNNSVRVATFSKMAAARGQHTLPQLPYAYDVSYCNPRRVDLPLTSSFQALEPSISKEIMTLHHTKHHQTYVNGLNTAQESLAKLQSQEASPETVKAAIALQPALKFNGGGHINHSLFWKNLAPHKSDQTKLPAGSKFAQAVERDFGSLENLKKEVNTKTAAVQGSGWGWLVSLLNHNNRTRELTPPYVERATTRPLKSWKSSLPPTRTLCSVSRVYFAG